MKKLIPAAYLIVFTLLLSGCTSDVSNNDEDTALTAQIQGKWKLTESYSDDQPAPTPIVNGYEIEFKADKTFISNEENGYTGGTYTVLKSKPNNLMLIYHKNYQAKQVYKYLNMVDALHIDLEGSTPEPTEGNPIFLSGYILTRIP